MNLVLHLRRHASAAWRHRWKALGLTWFVCIAGWIAVYLMPNQYVSTARMYADADAILGTLLRGIAVEGTPASQVDVLQRTLLSRPNLERVVARTDLDMRITNVQSREQLIVDLGRQIRITPQTRNLFSIEYRDHDPRVARDVVQTLLTLFIEAATGTDRRQLETARNFVAQQIAAYEAQLREAERRRAEFRARYGDLLALDGNSSRLETARARLQELRGELADAQARRDLTRQQLDALQSQPQPAGRGVGSPELAQAEQQLRQLRMRYTDQHPDVVATRNMIAELRRGGGGGGGRAAAPGPSMLREPLTLRMVDADAQIASLERNLRDAEGDLARMSEMARSAPEVQAEFTNLDRDYNVLRRNYEELLARRESIQIGEAARTSSDRVKIEIIDPPTMPTIPAGPNRPLLATGVLAAGIGAGVALALLLVQIDTTFYSVNELRRLGLPVLGGISAPPVPTRRVPLIAFAGAAALILVAYGAMLGDTATLLARVVRFIA